MKYHSFFPSHAENGPTVITLPPVKLMLGYTNFSGVISARCARVKNMR
jgi:hypothetical protein